MAAGAFAQNWHCHLGKKICRDHAAYQDAYADRQQTVMQQNKVLSNDRIKAGQDLPHKKAHADEMVSYALDTGVHATSHW